MNFIKFLWILSCSRQFSRSFCDIISNSALRSVDASITGFHILISYSMRFFSLNILLLVCYLVSKCHLSSSILKYVDEACSYIVLTVFPIFFLVDILDCSFSQLLKYLFWERFTCESFYILFSHPFMISRSILSSLLTFPVLTLCHVPSSFSVTYFTSYSPSFLLFYSVSVLFLSFSSLNLNFISKISIFCSWVFLVFKFSFCFFYRFLHTFCPAAYSFLALYLF